MSKYIFLYHDLCSSFVVVKMMKFRTLCAT